jgi:hypothetical protein
VIETYTRPISRRIIIMIVLLGYLELRHTRYDCFIKMLSTWKTDRGERGEVESAMPWWCAWCRWL